MNVANPDNVGDLSSFNFCKALIMASTGQQLAVGANTQRPGSPSLPGGPGGPGGPCVRIQCNSGRQARRSQVQLTGSPRCPLPLLLSDKLVLLLLLVPVPSWLSGDGPPGKPGGPGSPRSPRSPWVPGRPLMPAGPGGP